MGEYLASVRNRRIVAARKLEQRKYRQQQRRFLVEGLQLLHLGLAAGVEPLEVFFCEALFRGAGAPSLLARCRATRAEAFPVSVEVMASLSGRDAPQGLIAVFPFVDRPLEELELIGQGLVLVFDRLQNPGNLGTLLRTADAVGAAAAIALEPGADLYDPLAVRGSMGSLFNLPVIRVEDADRLFAYLKERRLPVVGADPHQGQVWCARTWSESTVLVLGNEARGLSAEVRRHVEEWVRLPISGKAESLNVAVVGGVLMYAWVEDNRLLGR